MEFQFESIGPALRIVTVVFLFGFVLAIIGAAVAIASLPGQIARQRKHPQAAAINVCGWFGLPTGVLWVAAMVWAYTKEREAASRRDPTTLSQRLKQLEATVARIEASTKADK